MNKMAQKLAEIEQRKIDQIKELMKLIPSEVQEERMSICNSCEHLFKPTSTCKKCGCFMKLKTHLPAMKCPLGKWTKYEKSEE